MCDVVIPLEQESLDLAGITMVVDHNWSVNAKEAIECFGAESMRMGAGLSENHQINDVDDSNSNPLFLQDTSSSLASRETRHQRDATDTIVVTTYDDFSCCLDTDTN